MSKRERMTAVHTSAEIAYSSGGIEICRAGDTMRIEELADRTKAARAHLLCKKAGE